MRTCRAVLALVHGAVSVWSLAALAPCASADGQDPSPYITSHVLIGMTPNQGFEVTCEDSVLFRDPVVSSDLGITHFVVDYREDPLPHTVSVNVPAPPVITGLGVAAPGDSSVTIGWLTDRPATSQVEYGLSLAYGHMTDVASRLVRSHTMPVGPLAPETTYHYRAISEDAFGNRTTSQDRSFETLPEPPRVVGVAVVDTTPTTITLAWTTTRPCNAWVEYGATSTYGSQTPPTSALVTEHEVTVGGLTPNSLYHLRAAGMDDLGRTARSGDLTSTTAAPPPLVIASVAITDTTATTATIRWTTSRPGTSRVEYGTGTAYGSAAADYNMVTSHTLVLRNLEEDTVYHFRVVSRDQHGTTAASADGVFRTRPLGFEVTGVWVGEVTKMSITLLWTTTRASDSQVEYGPDTSYGGTTELAPALVTQHSVTVQSLTPATTYHLRGRSHDAWGQLVVTEDQEVMTGAPLLEITGVAIADTTGTTASIVWTTTNSATSCVEYGLTTSYGNRSPANAIPVTSHVASLAGLGPRTRYHFRVRAEDIYGQETVSGDFAFTTPAILHPGGLVITGISIDALGPTHARIAWQTTTEATSAVQYGTTPGLGQEASDASPVASHSVLLRGLVPATLYYFRVRSEGFGQHEALSQTYTFVTSDSDAVPPAVPDGLSAVGCQQGVALTWAPNMEDDLDGYRVYRRQEGEPSFTLLEELPGAAVEHIDRDVLAAMLYEYAIAAIDAVGNESALSASVVAYAGLAAEPSVWVLPNPVRDGAAIRFTSPNGQPNVPFSAAIYDAAGRLVKHLASGRAESAVTTLWWRADDVDGTKVASGTYFCMVALPSRTVRAKLMVLR